MVDDDLYHNNVQCYYVMVVLETLTVELEMGSTDRTEHQLSWVARMGQRLSQPFVHDVIEKRRASW